MSRSAWYRRRKALGSRLARGASLEFVFAPWCLRSWHYLDMKRQIVGYHIDVEGDWVAELRCGHRQHVRDDPPWRERPWVRTEEGRASRLGQELNCVRCDEFAREIAEAVIKECRASLVAAYEEAGMSGLCAEGRWEMALDSLRSIKLSKIIS